MKLAIMQPYFLPYIGYWQLLASVDAFVLYDNIQYTKKGWMNRNRFLRNGADALFTLPLKKDSDFLDVCRRSLAADFRRKDLCNQLEAAYRKAPYFRDGFPVVQAIIDSPLDNLFAYIANSIAVMKDHLGITTPITISSTIPADHSLHGKDKVVAICKAMAADQYINAIGGQELYEKDSFAQAGIDLRFIRAKPISYQQHGNPFVANLSIVDVLMFNSRDSIRAMLGEYDLV